MNKLQPSSPLSRSLRRLRAAFWRRRVVHWLVRALWSALLVPTVFMAGYLWLGWQVRWYDWLIPMLLVGFLTSLWSLRPLSLKKMARRLDRRLGLRARLITAFEVNDPAKALDHSENPVVERLFLETINTVISLRRYVRPFGRGFWVEMQTLIAVAALLSAMLMLDALTPRVPHATPVELPLSWQEPKADEVIPPDPELFPPPFPPETQIQQTVSQEQVQQALEALADALRDQAATRSIAEALDRGDLAGAAEGLRRLADQLGDLSEEARSELGQSLQEAAASVGENVPDLNQPLQSGSNALEGNDLRAAQQALEELAKAIESIEETPQETAQTQPEGSGQPGESGQPQAGESGEAQQGDQNPSDQPGDSSGSGAGKGNAGEGNDQPATEEERLAVEGQPLELESDPGLEDRVLQPAELDAKAGDERTDDSPFARQPPHTTTGDFGPDPLTYPWEKRDVIRRYFTP